MERNQQTANDCLPPQIKLNSEVLEYLKTESLNFPKSTESDRDRCEKEICHLLSLLPIPPLFTVVRVNTLQQDPEPLLALLKEQLIDNHRKRAVQLAEPFFHPLMPDVVIIPNAGPVQSIERRGDQVVVDHMCGMSVLRGSEVFVKGIIGAPLDMTRGDIVSLYVDMEGSCLRGQTQPLKGEKIFLGNGVALVSRNQIFRDSSPDHVLSGVGVSVTNALYSAPRLDNLTSDLIFAQNLPSAVCSYVLNPRPNDTVLDMCAAPGGKTTHIATLMRNKGRLVAIDRTKPKAERLTSLVSCWGLTCVEVYAFDSTKSLQGSAEATKGPPYPPGTFDRILLDAPCSALGQRPSCCNKMCLSFLKSFPMYQRKLLRQAVGLLKVGGTLVYSTCTITLAENEEQVAWVLASFPQLVLTAQEPHIGDTGLVGSSLSPEHLKLVQRFKPDVSGDSKDAFNRDTIGFFIAKFIKVENVK
uniref:SAM-dependent MTase RsmB/NOP-type domain-containing protein n=1 Tax=Octopus bimaculoides TaxID=37653 RepID=A0A0L8HSL2_OCTBM|eukprot:XP_014769695.1 PREDICTED: putative methyltransferase NSUN6 [Octopus bimaculoides]